MTSVVVLGDINLEISSTTDTAFASLTSDRLCYQPVRLAPGGTAVNFALAAAGLFDSVTLLGAVGDDLAGEQVERALNESTVDIRLMRAAGMDTGLIVAIRDAAGTGGVRLLVVRSPNANAALNRVFVEAHAALLAQADLLVTDGYSMLAEPRRSATLEAMRLAGGTVVFDLVPHHIDAMIGLADLDSWLTDVDVLVVEAGTIGALLGTPRPAGVIELPHATRVLAKARTRYPNLTFLLRFGTGNSDQSLVAQPDREPLHSYTGYRDTPDPHGFGDRLTATELATHVTGHADIR